MPERMLPRTATSLIDRLWHTLPESRRTSFLKGHPLVWRLYRYLADGIWFKPIPKGRYLVTWKGLIITIPENDCSLIKEVFQERVYEQFFSCGEGDSVVDIGAHVGCFTMKAAKAVGNQGLVIAIEPEPENLAMLDENIRRNKLTNVK